MPLDALLLWFSERPDPLCHRRAGACHNAPPSPQNVMAETTLNKKMRAFDDELEGIVSKRKDSAYRSGRSPDWLKMKKPMRRR